MLQNEGESCEMDQGGARTKETTHGEKPESGSDATWIDRIDNEGGVHVTDRERERERKDHSWANAYRPKSFTFHTR